MISFTDFTVAEQEVKNTKSFHYVSYNIYVKLFVLKTDLKGCVCQCVFFISVPEEILRTHMH